MANHYDPPLEALGRIISQVKAFRDNPENPEERLYGPHLTRYLEQRLSAEDWGVWQDLQKDWEPGK